MAKTKKRKQSDQAGLFNLTGVGENVDDSLEGLLAEMDGTSGATSATSGADTTTTVEQVKTPDAYVESNGDVQPWDLSSDVIAIKNKDQVSAWNNALRHWTKTGKYSDALLPNFDVELARHFQVEKISTFLLKSAEDLKMPTFERWIIDSKLEEEKASDPVLPNADTTTDASQRLLTELAEKLDPIQAEQVLQDVCLQTSSAMQELAVLHRRTATKCPLRKGDRIDVEDRNDDMMALLYRRKTWKKPYCIKLNVSHYNKLKSMFEGVHGEISSKAMHAFNLVVMCLLLRYSSLSGGQLLNDLRGGGMQGAIHPHVFSSLTRIFGMPCVEAFASPLNAYYPQFGSAFADLDWHFGSVGDFFDQRLTEEGCFEANPPFSPGLMMKMATEMQNRLMRADKKRLSLTFVVVVPSAASKTSLVAKDFCTQSFEVLSKLSSKHVLLKSREHGYVEGAQHLKPTRYKESPYDTSVFVLQSKESMKVTNLAPLEESLRIAFSSQHEDELQKRKEKKPASSKKWKKTE